jgi:CRISPR-associated endonuclease/helicase Cas3
VLELPSPVPTDESASACVREVPRAPALLPAHLDAWAHTSPLPHFASDVEPWLVGVGHAADVHVVWRSEISFRDQSLDDVIRHLSLRRPSALEAMPLPLHAARRWLAGEGASPIADVVGGDAVTAEVAWSQRHLDSSRVVALRWRGDASTWIAARELAAGDVIIVPCTKGGIDEHGVFDPASTAPVTDLGDLANLRARGRASLRLEPLALEPFGLSRALRTAPQKTSRFHARSDLEASFDQWVAAWPGERPRGTMASLDEWRRLRAAITSRRTLASCGSVLVVAAATEGPKSVLDAITEDDGASFRGAATTLNAHRAEVRARAEHAARGIGLPKAIVDDIALAASLLDLGKLDLRMQRWLVGGAPVDVEGKTEPLVLSALGADDQGARAVARERAGYPADQRYELLSLAIIDGTPALLSAAHDAELVRHLVASHRGQCRPFASANVDDDAQLEPSVVDGVTLGAPARTKYTDAASGVGERFWTLVERYGWWGLAWLEAVVRLAAQSAAQAQEKERP